jgi:hypothetical protein
MQRLTAGLLLLAILAPAVHAQGTLSTQGFGYPPGELSTRAAAMGGASAPFDPLSPINPAALTSWGSTALYFQYSPEYRSVTVDGASDHAMISRFPLISAATMLGDRTTVSLSTSTFLDRTWETARTAFEHGSSGDSAEFTEHFSVAGAINDVRLGVAYQIAPRVRIGVGGHVFTGKNRLDISRTFLDTAFASFSQNSTISYAGSAFSGGIEVEPVAGVWLAASGRLGGRVEATSGDTTLSRAHIPDEYGGAIEFTGLSGFLFAARAQWTGWSSMSALGARDVTAVDGWDIGVGAEVNGPTVFGGTMPLRVGYRNRTLPFSVGGREVTERSISAGFAIPGAGDRSRLDIGVQHASRRADVAATERAWTISAGIFLRP